MERLESKHCQTWRTWTHIYCQHMVYNLFGGTIQFENFYVWLKDALSMVVPIWIHGACAFVPAGRDWLVGSLPPTLQRNIVFFRWWFEICWTKSLSLNLKKTYIGFDIFFGIFIPFKMGEVSPHFWTSRPEGNWCGGSLRLPPLALPGLLRLLGLKTKRGGTKTAANISKSPKIFCKFIYM